MPYECVFPNNFCWLHYLIIHTHTLNIEHLPSFYIHSIASLRVCALFVFWSLNSNVLAMHLFIHVHVHVHFYPSIAFPLFAVCLFHPKLSSRLECKQLTSHCTHAGKTYMSYVSSDYNFIAPYMGDWLAGLYGCMHFSFDLRWVNDRIHWICW